MAQPIWLTPKGSLGSYSSESANRIELLADPTYPASSLTFTLLNGSLPTNMTIDQLGVIRGTADVSNVDTINTFTVRATDNLGTISDRTFSITILKQAVPSFVTPSGTLMSTTDSTWIEYQVEYIGMKQYPGAHISVVSGALPAGLEINQFGLIRGYPRPPLNSSGNPTTTASTFTLQLTTAAGSSLTAYNIVVENVQINSTSIRRVPEILNYNPLTFVIDKHDPYQDYYIRDGYVPTTQSGNYFTFKIIGHDFDSDVLAYEYFDLPLGLIGDPVTGWITGTPTLSKFGISDYQYSVRVSNATNSSSIKTFTVRVANNLSANVTWNTAENLGTINNNTISEFEVSATADADLIYEVVSGDLPPALKLAKNGQLLGKVVNQPTNKVLSHGDRTVFNFTIRAYAPFYPLISSTRTFTVTVKQYFAVPTDNMYFKATTNLSDRKIIDSLLTDEALIPNAYLYRPDDVYFGKAKEVKFVQVYGINASTIEQYVSAIDLSHYWRSITLGPLKTAVAKDDLGNVLHEVVYSEIIDSLAKADGTSVAQKIRWPKYINLNKGPWDTKQNNIYDSYERDDTNNIDYSTSLDPGSIITVYPASFANMRKQIASVLDENYDSQLLPRWMRSQQPNGSILGYTQAWVVCYTKPGYAQAVVDNINNDWNHKLNEIYFQIDRYAVDKSSTFDYNSYLSKPEWLNLPSSTPAPDPIDMHDFYVLFPRKTILPK